MKHCLAASLAAALLFAACGQKKDAAAPASSSSSGNPLTAPVDYIGAVGKAKNVAEKQVDLASVNKAIQLFQAQEDRLPRDLNELVAQRYLPALPSLPTGSRFAYNPQTGDLKVVKQ